jgi:hypothetical protein
MQVKEKDTDVRERLSVAVAAVDLASLPALTPYVKRADENSRTP